MPQVSSPIRPAVAIPIYKTELTAAEQVSIRRCVEVLATSSLFFIGPDRLRTHLESLCAAYGGALRARTFDDRFFSGITGYNALMRSAGLYRAFQDHSHLLIAQTDALVISDELHAWCERGYSYVGAPWFVGGSRPQLPLRFFGVGNGGFSLRSVEDCLRVLTSRRHIPHFVKSRAGQPLAWLNLPNWIKHQWCLAYNVEPFFPSANEDLFWGMLVPAACPFFRVPTPEDALGFAFEAEPRQLYQMNGQRLPFGCHAWERFDREFWETQLPFLRAAGG